MNDDYSHPAEAAFEHSQLDGGGRAKGRKGRGREGGGDVQISRALSRLLRHQAENAGIKLDKEGYAPLDRVMAWGPLRSLNPAMSDIQRIVSENEKQRFSLKINPSLSPAPPEDSQDPSHFLIRANQGHSIAIQSEGLMTPIVLSEDPDTLSNLPPLVMHGTYFAFWPLILSSGGLRRMSRNHVHCTTGYPEDNIVGMRKDAELIIEIDVEKSITEGGLKWWKSENGYVLSEGDEEGIVSLRYFKEVRGRAQGVGVLMQNGEVVAELPEGIKLRTPIGKQRGKSSGGKGRGRGRP